LKVLAFALRGLNTLRVNNLRHLILGLLILPLTAEIAYPQVTKRIIPLQQWVIDAERRAEYIQLELDFLLDGKQIQPDREFDSDGNWLKKLIVRVRNVGKKPIVVFGVGGGLLEGLGEELQTHESYKYGIGWNWKRSSKHAALRPGHVIDLTYANVDTLTRKVLSQKGEAAFRKLNFMAPEIRYADGTREFEPVLRFRKS
jgi:hypothetical protein